MRSLWVVLGAVVGIVVVIFILRGGFSGGSTDPGQAEDLANAAGGARSLVVLDAEGSAAEIIKVYEPADGARARIGELSSVTFRWSSVEGAPRYMFVANNEMGQVLWRSLTPDTVLTLSPKVSKATIPGDRLKWIVQVPSRSASSDIYRVEIIE